MAVSPDAVVTVSSPAGKRELSPKSEAHAKLEAWMAANQYGWSQYLATPPVRGVRVFAPGFDLQFIDSTVLVHTTAGYASKSVAPDEYAFLTVDAGERIYSSSRLRDSP